MRFYVFVKKVNLTTSINSKYWGTLGRLFELQLTDSQVIALIDFFESLERYRNYITASVAISQGDMVRFLKTEQETEEGLMVFGLVDPQIYKNVVNVGEEYETFIAKRAALYNLLGWVEEEERVIEIDSEVNETTLTWSNVPVTFQEGMDFYQRGIPVSEFFKD